MKGLTGYNKNKTPFISKLDLNVKVKLFKYCTLRIGDRGSTAVKVLHYK